jgi:hypothetical protein
MKTYMRITRPLEPAAIPACFMMNNMHIYYPTTPEEQMDAIAMYHRMGVGHLCLPDDFVSAKRFLDFIQDGFEELAKQRPDDYDREEKVIGELNATWGDVKINREVTK